MQLREQMRQAKSALQHLLLDNRANADPGGYADDELGLEDHDHACIICLDAPRSMIFWPCKHVVVCTACSKLVMASGALCPMCREVIADHALIR